MSEDEGNLSLSALKGALLSRNDDGTEYRIHDFQICMDDMSVFALLRCEGSEESVSVALESLCAEFDFMSWNTGHVFFNGASALEEGAMA